MQQSQVIASVMFAEAISAKASSFLYYKEANLEIIAINDKGICVEYDSTESLTLTAIERQGVDPLDYDPIEYNSFLGRNIPKGGIKCNAQEARSMIYHMVTDLVTGL